MISSVSLAEREALDEIERRLNGRGYTVRRQPAAGDVPAFLGKFQPDAIALGKTPNLVVEVVTRGATAAAQVAKIEQLRKLLEGQPDWRLEVVYTAASGPAPSVVPITTIRERLEQTRRLARVDRPAALLLAWALVEAIARTLEPEHASRALAPATTVELLASLGYVAEPEAEVLRKAWRSRDLIAHGDVTVDAPATLVTQVLDIADTIVRNAETREGLSL